MRSAPYLLVLAALPLTGPAFGQATCSNLAQCTCAAPLASFPPGSARLSDMQGAVQVTAVNPGADPAATMLTVGDSAVVLAGGSATLNFGGSCTAALPPQSSLVIRAVEGCACAQVVEASTTAAGGDTGSGGVNPAVVVGGVVAAGAIGAGAYFLSEGDDDDRGSLE